MSKGSRPRPFSVSQKEWETRWDAIFNKPVKDEDDELSTESDSPDETKNKATEQVAK